MDLTASAILHYPDTSGTRVHPRRRPSSSTSTTSVQGVTGGGRRAGHRGWVSDKVQDVLDGFV